MLISKDKIAELFSILDSLGQLEAAELLGHFTGENIEAMRRISGLLKEDHDLERMWSEKRFVQVVQELFEMRKIWAEKLGETLTNAAREYDLGNRVQAIWILNGFIRFCTSPYYCDIAGEVIGKYEEEQ